MSSLFPEQPVLFYPSLACRFGSDEALLLSLYHRLLVSQGNLTADGHLELELERRQWLALAEFWNEERLATVTSSLVQQELVAARFYADGRILLSWLETAPVEELGRSQTGSDPQAACQEDTPSSAADAEGSRRASSDLMEQQGPAPCFGGSIGWQRPQDPLESLFAQREEQNRRLHNMYPEWQPDAKTWQALREQSIPEEFSREQIQEFVLYWMERDRRESAWGHLFMRHVKRRWVNEQSRQGRIERESRNAYYGVAREGYSTDTRARRREAVTDSIMDINNTDW